jgi:competence protein ComEA
MKQFILTVCLFFFLTATAFASAININTATQMDLETLPGIGPAKAEAIIAYRKVHKFESVDDLAKVKGIGEKSMVKLKELITIKGK